jgi:glycosyltransferase involved in cell wall biosynthesis
MSKIVVASLSPDSSSRLPRYLGNSLEAGNQVTHAWPQPNRLRNLVLMGLTFHPNRVKWRDAYERETQHRLRNWHEATAQLQANPLVRDSDVILQEGLHFNSYPSDYRGKCGLYLHGMLSMVLDNKLFDCSMWRPHDDEIAPWRAGEDEVLARADRIFIGSKFLGPILESTYRVPREKILFVGTGQPPLPGDLAAPHPYAASKRILFVGKDFERKGGDFLIRAFSEVVAKEPSARLQIVGPRKLNGPLHPQIEFLGRVNDRQVLNKLFREAAIFAMPSLHESFGFVFLEAMSCGLPCVAANIHAMPEIVEHGKSGLIVEPGDSAQLAEALLRLIQNPGEAEKMGAVGRERARIEFVWQLVGDRMLAGLGLGAAAAAAVS